jgi:UDP-perosamine 4-acetyltransferase
VIETLVAGIGGFDLVGLIDDEQQNARRRIGELSVLGSRVDLPALSREGVEGVLLGFGAVEGRDAVVAAIEAAGLALPTLVHPSAHVPASATLGSGTQVLSRASIGPGARIGRAVLLNTGAIVEHDVTISDYAVIGPGAVLAGRAGIGEAVEIGAGAVVLPDMEVSVRAVVGAGAVVTDSVAEGQTVVGVPARSRQGADRAS